MTNQDSTMSHSTAELMASMNAIVAECGQPDCDVCKALKPAATRLEHLERALDVARKQIVEITCDATEKLREIGYECDPPERTYTPALDRVDAALTQSGNE